MQHENNDVNNITLEDSNLTFKEVYSKPYVPKQYIEHIKGANVLMIPDEDIRYGEGWVFPEYTNDIYEYFEDSKNENINFDICINDDKFQKLELHADVITLVTFLVEYSVLPIVTSLISAFLKDKIRKTCKSSRDTNVKVNIIAEKDGDSKKITYSGNIENFDAAMKSIEDVLFKK